MPDGAQLTDAAMKDYVLVSCGHYRPVHAPTVDGRCLTCRQVVNVIGRWGQR